MGSWSRSIIALVAGVAVFVPNVVAQGVNPADGEGLVVDYPVFNPVQPPNGYVAASRPARARRTVDRARTTGSSGWTTTST